jgi:hypothetical protein
LCRDLGRLRRVRELELGSALPEDPSELGPVTQQYRAQPEHDPGSDHGRDREGQPHQMRHEHGAAGQQPGGEHAEGNDPPVPRAPRDRMVPVCVEVLETGLERRARLVELVHDRGRDLPEDRRRSAVKPCVQLARRPRRAGAVRGRLLLDPFAQPAGPQHIDEPGGCRQFLPPRRRRRRSGTADHGAIRGRVGHDEPGIDQYLPVCPVVGLDQRGRERAPVEQTETDGAQVGPQVRPGRRSLGDREHPQHLPGDLRAGRWFRDARALR